MGAVLTVPEEIRIDHVSATYTYAVIYRLLISYWYDQKP